LKSHSQITIRFSIQEGIDIMTATIIDGQAVADRLRAEVAESARKFKDKHGYAPGLGAVLAGEDPASQMYVRMKRKACEKAGIDSVAHTLSVDSSQEEVESIVRQLNDDPKIHGILVQPSDQIDKTCFARQP
jgi:methylenetetrahydrofolate dehydrogenase (NADP+)/methenyltetrahydrofolate cyclohydrolase